MQKKTRGTKVAPLAPKKHRGSRAAVFAVAGSLALLGVAGCTPSGSPALSSWSLPEGENASVGKAIIGVPQAGVLPLPFLDELAAATGLALSQAPVAIGAGGVVPADEPAVSAGADVASVEQVDVLMGYDAGWFSADLTDSKPEMRLDLADLSFLGYGYDDACVLVNATWFSANNLVLPDSVNSLPEGALESIVSGSDPDIDPYALSAAPQWGEYWKTWSNQNSKSSKASKEQQSDEGSTPQSGSVADAFLNDNAIGMVGSALEPIRNPNNLGTDTRYRLLSETCVEREVILVDLSVLTDRKRDDSGYIILADFLAGNAGAELLEKYGIANPSSMDGTDGVGSEAIPAFSAKETATALHSWERTFR